MRILFLTPSQPHTTGNWVSALRQKKELENLGHCVRILEVTEDTAHLEAQANSFAPDIVNALHAYRSGVPWLTCPASQSIPLAVTLTGTDVHQGLDDPQQRPAILQVLARADAILTLCPATRQFLEHTYPALTSKLHHVPPAVDLGAEPFDLRKPWNIPDSAVLFLHPAGIRPVKGNLELLEMFDKVVDSQRCRLAFCGPVLDRDYASRFFSALQKRPWAVHVGEIPHTAMAAVMRQADVILNNSASEGFSNTLLEAGSLGIPILARNIPGNAAAFRSGLEGLVFDTAEQFIRQAIMLTQHPAMRRRFSQPLASSQSMQQEARQMASIFSALKVRRRATIVHPRMDTK